jgi:hypothetical protein
MAKLYEFPVRPTLMQDLPLAMLVNKLQDGDTYEEVLKEMKRRYLPSRPPRPTTKKTSSRRRRQ